MKLEHIGCYCEVIKLEAFSNWIANISDGIIGGANDAYANIGIPKDI